MTSSISTRIYRWWGRIQAERDRLELERLAAEERIRNAKAQLEEWQA